MFTKIGMICKERNYNKFQMMQLFSVIIYNLWGNYLQSKKKWIVMITQIKQSKQLFVWLFSLCALNSKWRYRLLESLKQPVAPQIIITSRNERHSSSVYISTVCCRCVKQLAIRLRRKYITLWLQAAPVVQGVFVKLKLKGC